MKDSDDDTIEMDATSQSEEDNLLKSSEEIEDKVDADSVKVARRRNRETKAHQKQQSTKRKK